MNPKYYNDSELLLSAQNVLKTEAQAIENLIPKIDQHFLNVINLIYKCTGRIVVTGMGKSGLICRKLAATLASTGTPAFFLHPAEGVHGDLGMLVRNDVVLAVSNSGETAEVLALIPIIKRLGIPIVAITSRQDSTLAKYADVTLNISVSQEACPFDLIPTASTTATLALGDALAIALLQKRGFSEQDFALLHPAGHIGKKLMKVSDFMHTGQEIPIILEDQPMKEAILEITIKTLGCTAVVDKNNCLKGIITDGDLRRAIEKDSLYMLNKQAQNFMTKNPKIINPEALAAHALNIMETHIITALLVVDESSSEDGLHHLVGILKLQDLLKGGVI